MNTLQRLSGKCVSFSLAVPGARLFLNEINLAIGSAKGFVLQDLFVSLVRLSLRFNTGRFWSLGLAFYPGALYSTIRLYCVQMPLLLHGAVSLTPP